MSTITLTLTVPATFEFHSKAAGETFTIDTGRIVDPADLIEYALGVIVQRASAGKADSADESAKAIRTRIANLYTEGTSRVGAPRKDLATKIAEEMLAAYAKAKAKTLPGRKTPEYAAILAKFTEARKDVIESEVKRRKAEAEIEIDLEF